MNKLSRRKFLTTTTAAVGTSAVVGTSLSGKIHTDTASLKRTEESLKLVCSDYVRFMPVATGDVRPKGMTLDWIRGDRTEMLRRALGDQTIHGGETSMARHLMRTDQNDRSFVAVPVFLLRNFTARDIYVKKGSSLKPADLNHSRLGMYNWAASGAVWYRHLLRHLTNDSEAVKSATWVIGGVDVPSPTIRIPDPPPPNITRAPEGKSLSDLLISGEIDALLGPLPPARHHSKDGPIVRLIPNFQSIESAYFEKMRCYPPQHVIVIRREIWEKDPSVGRKLVAAFNECETKFWANQRLYPYNSPWIISDIQEAEHLMGSDYHAHGLEKNRHAVDTFCQGGFDDELTKRRVTVEEFFADFLNT